MPENAAPLGKMISGERLHSHRRWAAAPSLGWPFHPIPASEIPAVAGVLAEYPPAHVRSMSVGRWMVRTSKRSYQYVRWTQVWVEHEKMLYLRRLLQSREYWVGNCSVYIRVLVSYKFKDKNFCEFLKSQVHGIPQTVHFSHLHVLYISHYLYQEWVYGREWVQLPYSVCFMESKLVTTEIFIIKILQHAGWVHEVEEKLQTTILPMLAGKEWLIFKCFLMLYKPTVSLLH